MSEKNQTIKTKPVGRGGVRANAGRKKSALTKKTQEVAAKVMENAADGTTPLEIMMQVMHWFLQEAGVAMHSEDPKVKASASKFMVLAQDAAMSAAPYVHPRLAAVEVTGKDGKDLLPPGSGVLVVPAAMSMEQWEKAAAKAA